MRTLNDYFIAAEIEDIGSRIVDPVDVRPSRQYSLNDLVPDPNIRKTTNTRRSPTRPVYMDNPNTPFGGNRHG